MSTPARQHGRAPASGAPLARACRLLLFACAALLLCSTAAPAQTAGPGDADLSDKPKLFVVFGLPNGATIGRTAADRWMPVAVSIQGGALPFEGIVRVEYAQDSTQTAIITTPVAATPGRATSIQLALPIPAFCQRMEFQLLDPHGAIQQRSVFNATPSATELPLPTFSPVPELAILGVGQTGGPASSLSHLTTGPTPRSVAANTPGARTALVPPAAMPLMWAAYDGLSALVVEADASLKADPRAIAAVHEWVSAGGRLVIIASDPGSEWRAWLPPAPFGQFVTLDDPAPGPIPADLAAAAIATTGRRYNLLDYFPDEAAAITLPAPGGIGPPVPGRQRSGADNQPDGPPPPPAPSSDQRDEPAPTPVASAMQRLIRLTPHGAAYGWRIRWSIESPRPDVPTVEPPGASSRAGNSGLLAEGPVGFGWVTIVGIDPRRPVTPSTARSLRAVWSDLLGPGITTAVQRSYTTGGWYYGAAASPADAATSLLLDHLSNVPTAGTGAFPILIIAMILLALLVGPVDAVVLKRLGWRHRSWLTALVWIGAASLAAYQAPLLGRSSGTVVNRASVIDVLFPPGAAVTMPEAPAIAATPGQPPLSPAPILTAGDGFATPLAWHTSLTGIFAGATTSATFAGDGVARSWWRGISAVRNWNNTGISAGSVPTVQTLPSLAALGNAADPWGGWEPGPTNPSGSTTPPTTPAPQAGGCPLAPMGFALWTFRTLEDRGRTLPPCDVRLIRTTGDGARDSGDSGRLEAVVTGLPRSATIAAAIGRVGNRWHPLQFAPSPDGDGFRARLGDGERTPPSPWNAALDVQQYTPWGAVPSGVGRLALYPMAPFNLAGPDDRAAVIDQMLATGRWAVVYLVLEGMPPDVTLQVPEATHNRTVMCRCLVPIPAPTPPTPSTTP